jgi:hypothetical protein
MAILIHEDNKIEVRVKKYPLDSNDYFAEYVKLGERAPITGIQTRYIIAEDGVTYAIEIVLKKGFYFGEYAKVRARLTHLGTKISIKDMDRPTHLGDFEATKSDMVFFLEANDPIVDGKIVKGARFAFQALAAGMYASFNPTLQF